MTDRIECDGCLKTMDASLLDAVILDAKGNEASDRAYCETCHSHYKVIDSDKWRAGQ